MIYREHTTIVKWACIPSYILEILKVFLSLVLQKRDVLLIPVFPWSQYQHSGIWSTILSNLQSAMFSRETSGPGMSVDTTWHLTCTTHPTTARQRHSLMATSRCQTPWDTLRSLMSVLFWPHMGNQDNTEQMVLMTWLIGVYHMSIYLK